MKTIAKLSVIFFLAVIIAGTINSCKKENSSGYMTVKMTDAPADYSQVNVDITGLEVHHVTEGWVNLEIKHGVYNLLELQNNISVVLADKVQFPEGKINQLRLILGTDNTIVTSIDTFQLFVPSGSETGLKINIDQEIKADRSIEIVLDFDANSSVVLEGNGKFLLKPVIKIKSITQV